MDKVSRTPYGRAAQYAKPPNRAQRPPPGPTSPNAVISAHPLPPSRRKISTLCRQVPPDPFPSLVSPGTRYHAHTPTFPSPVLPSRQVGRSSELPAGRSPPQGLCGRGRNLSPKPVLAPPLVPELHWKYPVHRVPRERSGRGRALHLFFSALSFPILSPTREFALQRGGRLTRRSFTRLITPLLYRVAALGWVHLRWRIPLPTLVFEAAADPLVSGTIELFSPLFRLSQVPPALGTPAWACHETRTFLLGTNSPAPNPTQTPPFLVVVGSATRQLQLVGE